MKIGRNHELKRSETDLKSCLCTQPSRGSPDQRQGVWRTLSPGGYPSFSTRMGAIFQLPRFATSCNGKEISCACRANSNRGSRKVSLESRFLLESKKRGNALGLWLEFCRSTPGLSTFYTVFATVPKIYGTAVSLRNSDRRHIATSSEFLNN